MREKYPPGIPVFTKFIYNKELTNFCYYEMEI